MRPWREVDNMQRWLSIGICTVLGYLLGATLASAIVGQMTSYAHNMALESAVWAAFIGGPIGAVIFGLAMAWIIKRVEA
ncbi:hypothetical protein [Variibacter gotjawalensis]|nr:hypothetical protein [Variibacter gotjawalensis]NIK47353.1 uncharacterized protein YaaW (UPF0174 family) [Variibacter gotjawalensis]